MSNDSHMNMGTRTREIVRPPKFPDAGAAVREHISARARPATAVDVLLVNPPSPDGGIWIRSQHRVGRKSRENMIWPQVSLAQLAALLHPDYSVALVDAIAERMTWQQFEQQLRRFMPKYYLTQVTAPTLLLWGEGDQRSPLGVAEQMHAAIPTSELRVIPDAGHVSNMEKPEDFNRRVLEFLR